MSRVTVFCSSSNDVAPMYFSEMSNLGEGLAKLGVEIVYGGAKVGLMGQLADSALAKGGFVKGVLPHYLNKPGIAHENLSELSLVDDLLDRKRLMLRHTDAVIAFPGGIGTIDEISEVMALKQLGEYEKPIYFVNFLDSWSTFFDYISELQQRGMVHQRLEELFVSFEDSAALLQQLEQELKN